MHGFRRILAVHEGRLIEPEVLEYAALFAALEPQSRLLVAVVPRGGIPSALAAAVHAAAAERGVRNVSLRLVTEPEQCAIFDEARRANSDLLVVRHPGSKGAGAEILRRYMRESPCAVCFVPPGSRPSLRRVAAAVDLGPGADHVMAVAAALCGAAGSERLIAVHALSASIALPEADEERRDEALLALYRCKSRASLAAALFTPIVTAGVPWSRSLQTAGTIHAADLLIAGGPSPSARRARRRLAVEQLAEACLTPLLCLPPARGDHPAPSVFGRVFSESEPAFS